MPSRFEPENNQLYDECRTGRLTLRRFFDRDRRALENAAWEVTRKTRAGESFIAGGSGHDLSTIPDALEGHPGVSGKHLQTLIQTAQLFRAAELNLAEDARNSLRRGADINALNEEGQTPLFSAVADSVRSEQDDPGVARLLLERGADPDARDSRGRSSLQFAASNANTATVSLLLDYGAHINARDDIGESPLHGAVGCLRLENATLLVRRGADINALNEGRQTPLDELRRGPFYDPNEEFYVKFERLLGGQAQDDKRQLATYDHLIDPTDMRTVKGYLRRGKDIKEVIVVREGVDLAEVTALLDNRDDAGRAHTRALALAEKGAIRFAVEDPNAVPDVWKPYCVPIGNYADDRSCRVIYAPPAYYVQPGGQTHFPKQSAEERPHDRPEHGERAARPRKNEQEPGQEP